MSILCNGRGSYPAFGAYLALVIDLLRNFTLQDLGGLCLLKNLILAKRQQSFEDKLAQGKSDEHVLPWEERTVEKTRELLDAGDRH